VVGIDRGGVRPPTLEVVAAKAGVSRATASRVLRGASNVSQVARDAVVSAAEEIGYTPNRAARSLVTRRSDSVAFLVAESEDRLFADPYFLSMLRGAQIEIAASGLQLLFVIVSTTAESPSSSSITPPVGMSTGCCWCRCTATTSCRRRSSGWASRRC
jgi:DNA-binding LacI/PurR family transcriptional regulator